MPNTTVPADGEAMPGGELTPDEKVRLRELKEEFFALIGRATDAENKADEDRLKRVQFERFVGDTILDLLDKISAELQPRIHLLDLAVGGDSVPSDDRGALRWAVDDVGGVVDDLYLDLKGISRIAHRRVEAELGRWVPLRDDEEFSLCGADEKD
ncbi:hypothetical protein [Acuticoccus mangrovi]|uniref:Uncharacterized protein n=1 Tax=Acuticoccus mangrovi TaxID=2796142 RepID=A0A934MEY0_9HYPH|nr:hypothetical protein [Acuticoccus mangrovi]MBJ3774340.1 hypothetical protein [Acuticoccus mangrovi]